MSKVDELVQEHYGEHTLLQHVTHWVYETSEHIIKVSSSSLAQSTQLASWLQAQGHAALGPETVHESEGYWFYTYPKGRNSLPVNQISGWMGKELNRLHDVTPPNHLNPMPYAEFVANELAGIRAGCSFLPDWVSNKIKDAQQLTDLRLVHGDPHAGNIIKLGGRLMFIDWDYHMLAPKEHDLAIVKFGQLFGASTELFDTMADNYGSYDTDRLRVMLDARLAVSTIWLADEIARNAVPDVKAAKEEVSLRLERLAGNETVILHSNKIRVAT